MRTVASKCGWQPRIDWPSEGYQSCMPSLLHSPSRQTCEIFAHFVVLACMLCPQASTGWGPVDEHICRVAESAALGGDGKMPCREISQAGRQAKWKSVMGEREQRLRVWMINRRRWQQCVLVEILNSNLELVVTFPFLWSNVGILQCQKMSRPCVRLS